MGQRIGGFIVVILALPYWLRESIYEGRVEVFTEKEVASLLSAEAEYEGSMLLLVE